jgi:hypothetical protein
MNDYGAADPEKAMPHQPVKPNLFMVKNFLPEPKL